MVSNFARGTAACKNFSVLLPCRHGALSVKFCQYFSKRITISLLAFLFLLALFSNPVLRRCKWLIITTIIFFSSVNSVQNSFAEAFSVTVTVISSLEPLPVPLFWWVTIDVLFPCQNRAFGLSIAFWTVRAVLPEVYSEMVYSSSMWVDVMKI